MQCHKWVPELLRRYTKTKYSPMTSHCAADNVPCKVNKQTHHFYLYSSYCALLKLDVGIFKTNINPNSSLFVLWLAYFTTNILPRMRTGDRDGIRDARGHYCDPRVAFLFSE